MDAEIKNILKKYICKHLTVDTAPKSLSFIKVNSRKTKNANIVVLVIDSDARKPIFTLKIPRNPGFTKGIKMEEEGLLNVRKTLVGKDEIVNIPSYCEIVEFNGFPALATEACIGAPAINKVNNRKSLTSLIEKLVQWNTQLTKYGMETDHTDDTVTINELDNLFSHIENDCNDAYKILSSDFIDHMKTIKTILLKNQLRLTIQHGDFNIYNVLQSDDKFSVIDWEDCTYKELPIIDINHLFVCSTALIEDGSNVNDKYINAMIKPGWYQELYRSSISEYSSKLGIQEKTFIEISPIYFLKMIKNMYSAGRQQSDTSSRWAEWGNMYVEHYISNKI